ncbi:MAG TPA: methyltransferase domain-containing protein [Acidimicrobiales bacterium]|nr:methyltransferase domain-containing protein [Acidimicrobiales bacterium]
MPPAPPVASLAWDTVDAAYLGYLNAHAEMPERWLLVQTLATGPSRRALFGALGVQEGAQVLDVGTGFGPTPLELAGMVRSDVLGLDADPANLAVAESLAATIRATGWFQPGSSVTFARGDAYDLPTESDRFDLATARLLFQHLADPARVADELFRVVRPGGGVCLIDADDGLSIAYPEPSDAFRRLQHAFAELQAAKGGDRFVGRKLSTLLEQAGFTVVSVVVLPQAVHGPSTPADPARAFSLQRLTGVRDELVEAGILGPEEVDTCLETFAREHVEGQCSIEAHLAVVARKPD